MTRYRRTILVVLIFLPCLVLSRPSEAKKYPKRIPFGIADVPYTDYDPYMEGAATEFAEWSRATLMPDFFFYKPAARAGYYYFQLKDGWEAESVQTGADATYPGSTFFVAHDIIGSGDPDNPLSQYRSMDDNDWNSFVFLIPGYGTVKIWVFANSDDPDDSDWLDQAEGLGSSDLIPEGASPNRIDDRGFIARLNDDPSTDVHWLPGMPEPGDAGWVWDAWHRVFGRSTFGQTFQSTGLDPDPEDAVDHEVYEFCAQFLPDSPPPWCIWEETFYVKIDDKLFKFTVLVGQWWLHPWNPPPLDPEGGPDVAQRVNRLWQRLGNLQNAATVEKAQNELQDAMNHLDAATTGLLIGGPAGLNPDSLKDFRRLLKDLSKAGKAEPAIQPEIVQMQLHSSSLFYSQTVRQAIDFDRNGADITNKYLRKAYKDLYDAGRKLTKIHGSQKDKFGSFAKKLEKMVKHLNKGIQRLFGEAAR